jgi:hypothetical protein
VVDVLPELAAATAALLRQHGIKLAGRARVTSAWTVDVNGDGKKETLWAARSRDDWRSPYSDPSVPGHSRAGDYSLLAIRYAAGSTRRNQALRVASFRSAAPDFTILCPLDLDGDGRLEIIAHQQNFEDDSLLLFRFDGTRVLGFAGTAAPAARPQPE